MEPGLQMQGRLEKWKSLERNAKSVLTEMSKGWEAMANRPEGDRPPVEQELGFDAGK